MKNETSWYATSETSWFTWVDYLIFITTLVISVSIGMYFGFCGPKQDNRKTYLMGGKNMNTIAVGLSLIASQTSGVLLLAYPADVYKYGATIWLMVGSMLIVFVINYFIFLPIFFNLQLTSIYEYFNLRFDKNVWVFASFLYTLSNFVYNPIVIYIPALSFSYVTGINVHYITTTLCIVCIFYTAVGGLKAVIWTDAIQAFSLLGSTITVFILGIISVDGFQNMWNTARDGERLTIDLSWDPTLRESLWIILIGATFHNMTYYSISQCQMQKYLSVDTLGKARRASIIYVIGCSSLLTISVLVGIMMYAKYKDCDPLLSNQISEIDQMVIYFTIDITQKLPGIPGIFIAGIFSAALSTLSAILNTISSNVYEDLIAPFLSVTPSEKTISYILKTIVVVAGFISLGLVFAIEKLGGLLPLMVLLEGIPNGALLGLFLAGIFVPSINARGALFGSVCGFALLAWIASGKLWYKSKGLLKDYSKPLSTDGCGNTFYHSNLTHVEDEEPFVLYRIAFWYNTLFSAVVVVIVGFIVSLVTKRTSRPVDPKLICSFLRRFYVDKVGDKKEAINNSVI